MSTAAKTPNYNLSQVAGSDIPDWITDYTSDMKKIDEALKENADDIATVRPDEFSEESTYAAGDYCIKDNVIYKAKTAVEAGAFDISDWTATTIFDELSGLNQNLSTLPTNIQSDNTINVLSVNLPYTFEKSGIIYMANNDSTGAILISGCWLGGFTANVFIPVTKGMTMNERTGNIATLNYIPNKES